MLCLAFQYHINKLSIMSSENHLNNSDKDVDEVDAALLDLEITLEGGKTSTILVRVAGPGGKWLACPVTSHKQEQSFQAGNSFRGPSFFSFFSLFFCTSALTA